MQQSLRRSVGRSLHLRPLAPASIGCSRAAAASPGTSPGGVVRELGEAHGLAPPWFPQRRGVRGGQAAHGLVSRPVSGSGRFVGGDCPPQIVSSMQSEPEATSAGSPRKMFTTQPKPHTHTHGTVDEQNLAPPRALYLHIIFLRLHI